MIDAYELLLDADPAVVSGAIYNIGAENMSIASIAETARSVVAEAFPEKGEIEIITTQTNDLRS